MQRLEAIRYAFRTGCGVRMSVAQRRAGIEPDDWAATLDLLGYLLMEQAQVCVPPQVMPQPGQTWQDLSRDERLKLMDRLKILLVNVFDQRERPNSPSHTWPFLPAEMGGWNSKLLKPSCLGVALIMLAWAEAWQAPVVMAEVHRRISELIHAAKLGMYEEADMLARTYCGASYSNDRRTPSRFAKEAAWTKRKLSLLRADLRTHTALIVELGGETQYCLDPYMNVGVEMDTRDTGLDVAMTKLQAEPLTDALFLNQTTWLAQAPLMQGLTSLRTLLPIVQQWPLDVSPDEVVARSWREFGDLGVLPQPDYWLERVAGFFCSDEALGDGVDPAEFLAGIAAERPQEVREQLWHVLLRYWGFKVWGAANERAQPHPSMELVSPRRSMAVATIITLRYRFDEPVIAADLLPYAAGVGVVSRAWRDQVRKQTTPTQDELIEQRLKPYQEVSQDGLHPSMLDALGAAKE